MWFNNLTLSVIFLASSVSCFPNGRVVNGSDSEVRKYPFIVSLRSSYGSHSCGSSIIAPRWILTAAHCVSGIKANRMSIQYASTKVGVKGENVVRVKRIIMHEDYAPAKSYANDIALLELEGSFVFNYKTLAPVNLPEPYFEIPQTQSGARGILVGWGQNATGGPVQKILQEVHLKIYSDEECNLRHNGKTTNDHICAGVDEGGKGQCSGDSGGPLLYKGSIQLGIVSWSKKPCTIAPFPGVYTKVSHYIEWIKKNIS